jgi:phage tail-like protein
VSEDWLVAQLPQVMAADPLVAGFVRGCQEVAESIRDRVGSVEHELDVDLASPHMLSFTASWLGVQLDTLPAAVDADARDAQRRLIRAVGDVLGWRGTAKGVELLLGALTGATRVEVTDSGGVFGAGDTVPAADHTVDVSINQLGGLSEAQVLAFLAQELPVTAQVRLRVGARHG